MSEEDKTTVDYLEVDDTIPGQNYVCLSFLSPESMMQKREAFNVCKFLQSYCKDQDLKYDELYTKYEDFVYKFSDKLQRDFDEQNDFKTSIRGVKVRGVYDTRGAAENRAKKLSTTDSSFHVFVGQVGYWLPWDPNADGIQDEVFQNSQLNDMMEKYQENNVNRDIFYEEQKREKVAKAREEAIRKKREAAEQRAQEKVQSIEDAVEEVKDGVEKVVDGVDEVKEGVEEVKEGVEETVEETVSAVNQVEEDIKKSLNDVDPWLSRKLQAGPEPEPEPVVESKSDDC
jgi:uncharacterized phage infection (PIP) family protein YhgE